LADLPAYSGLGTSSSFCVGLLNAVQFSINKKKIDQEVLACQAINIERNVEVELQEEKFEIEHGINPFSNQETKI
jgi:D-glycero-alpha-D-manno-heptose-7-phosphate kinase